MKRDTGESFLDKTIKTLLAPASFAYGVGSYARMSAYACGIKPRIKSAVSVISIGNITCGGTGKTPLTIYLARRFVEAGYKPAILSRGYKRKSHVPSVIVSDGQRILCRSEDSGDEPYLMASKCKGAVVIVGADRTYSAQVAVEKHNCNIIILDDGFQHLRLRRDLDIVLLDYFDDMKEDRLLPAGRLREPLSALSRASLIVISKVPENADQERLQELSQLIDKYAPGTPAGLVRFPAGRLIDYSQFPVLNTEFSQLANTADISKKKGIAFAGLAKPAAFFASLKKMGMDIVGEHSYPDHHWYSNQEMLSLVNTADKMAAEFLITTEKDMVRIPNNAPQSLLSRLRALTIETQWIGGEPQPISELLHE